MKHTNLLRQVAVIPAFLVLIHCPFPGGGGDGGNDGGVGALVLALLGGSGSSPSSTSPNLTVAAPVFSVTPGTYYATQSVKITTTTSGDSILFTNNGTDPTCPSTGTPYTGTISVPSSVTLKAIACKNGWTQSSVAAATYTIDGTVAAPAISLPEGTYTFNQSVTLTETTPSATIRYTTNGDDPTCSPPGGTLYSGPVSIAYPSKITLKAIGCRTGWTDSIITSATYDLSSTTPTSTVTPTSGSRIKKTDMIVIQFSEPMSTASLVVTGSLGVSSSTWKVVKGPGYDQVELAPTSGSWNTGDGKTLTINVKDAAGNPAAPLSLTYDVGSRIYVTPTGGTYPKDGKTPATAMSNIITAITSATAGDSVLVATGTYNISSQTSYSSYNYIIIKNGVSVYGGYSTDFQNRDPSVNQTTITDTCTTSCGVSIGAVSITQPTVFDGFTINGPFGSNVKTFFISSSSGLTVSNNTINGGTSSSGGMFSTNSTLAIYVDGSAATIINNTINGGSGGDSSTGIFVYSSAPVIRNNVIVAGTGVTSRSAIHTNTAAIIQNNTIDAGSGPASVGISIAGSGLPIIENNVIIASSGWAGVFEMFSGSNAASFQNNLIRGFTTLYHDADSNNDFSTLCGGNLGNTDCSITLTTPAGGGNVGTDPLFGNQATGDYHLGAGSPCSVARGGLDLSASIPQDRDGATRSVPLSIGAFEWDGSCQ